MEILSVVQIQAIISEINVGKRRIRRTMAVNLNDEFLGRLKID